MLNKILDMKKFSFFAFLMLFFVAVFPLKAQLTATEIITKADEVTRGESSIAVMTMTIVRPTYERTVEFKSWGKGYDKSLTIITFPPRDKGQVFLKVGKDVWNWQPAIDRTIKLPASMMSEGWMGSDFSNEDLLNESSMVVDYTHTLKGSENVSGMDCYKIEMMPKPNSPVVWGKVVKWISKEGFLQLKTEYYDDDNFLIKTEIGKEIKVMGGRKIPTVMEILPEEEKGNLTRVVIKSIEFNVAIDDDFFSVQKMKTIRP